MSKWPPIDHSKYCGRQKYCKMNHLVRNPFHRHFRPLIGCNLYNNIYQYQRRNLAFSRFIFKEQKGQDEKKETLESKRLRAEQKYRKTREQEYIPIYSYIKRTILFSPPLFLILWWMYKTWNPYPKEARYHLRAAILAHKYQNKPQDSIYHYKKAIESCVENNLPIDCLAVVGIKVLLAEALEMVSGLETDLEAALLYSDLTDLYLRHNDIHKGVSMAVRCGQVLQNDLKQLNLAETYYEFALNTMLQKPSKTPILQSKTIDLNNVNEIELKDTIKSLNITFKKQIRNVDGLNSSKEINDIKDKNEMLTIDSKDLASFVNARDLGATLYSLGTLFLERGKNDISLALFFQSLAAIDHDQPDEIQRVDDLICQRAIIFNNIATGMNNIGRPDLALTWASKSLSFSQYSQKLSQERKLAEIKSQEANKFYRIFNSLKEVINRSSLSKAIYSKKLQANDNSKDNDLEYKEISQSNFIQDAENSKLIRNKAISEVESINFPIKEINNKESDTEKKNYKLKNKFDECVECEIISLTNFAEILNSIRKLESKSKNNKTEKKPTIETKSIEDNLTIEKIDIDYEILQKYSNLDPIILLNHALEKSKSVNWKSGEIEIIKTIQTIENQ